MCAWWLGLFYLFLGWRKIINGFILFYCWEVVCMLGSGGVMYLRCVKKIIAQLSIVARVLASPLQLVLFV